MVLYSSVVRNIVTFFISYKCASPKLKTKLVKICEDTICSKEWLQLLNLFLIKSKVTEAFSLVGWYLKV